MNKKQKIWESIKKTNFQLLVNTISFYTPKIVIKKDDKNNITLLFGVCFDIKNKNVLSTVWIILKLLKKIQIKTNANCTMMLDKAYKDEYRMTEYKMFFDDEKDLMKRLKKLENKLEKKWN